MQLVLLFVDDEQYILKALKRSFRNMRRQWRMEFATTARQALEIMVKGKIDVVVSEIRLPDMDGRRFLEAVKKVRPEAVRIVMSGYADKDLLVKSIDIAHQLIAKPCDDEQLKAAIQRAVMIRDMLKKYGLKDIVVRMDRLPGLPGLYTDITAALKKEDTTVEDIADIVARDVGVTAKILKLVNSSFFGLPQHVTSLSKAIGMLGMDTVQAMALSACSVEQLCNRASGLSARQIWEHGFLTANFARSIARQEKMKRNVTDDTFMAGLMHDIGQMIVAVNLPEKWQAARKLAQKEGFAMHLAEEQVIGADHAVIGAYLLGLWGLPEPVVQAVCHHHHPDQEGCVELSPALIISIADAFAHNLEHLADSKTTIKGIDSDLAERLNLGQRLAKWQKICCRLLDDSE